MKDIAVTLQGRRSLAAARVRGGERLLEQTFGAIFSSDFEKRVDLSLNWVLAEEVSAEPVNGTEAGDFEVLQGLSQIVRFVICLGGRSCALECFTQPKLHLAGGFHSEGHRDDLLERGLARANDRDDTCDQDRCFT